MEEVCTSEKLIEINRRRGKSRMMSSFSPLFSWNNYLICGDSFFKSIRDNKDQICSRSCGPRILFRYSAPSFMIIAVMFPSMVQADFTRLCAFVSDRRSWFHLVRSSRITILLPLSFLLSLMKELRALYVENLTMIDHFEIHFLKPFSNFIMFSAGIY